MKSILITLLFLVFTTGINANELSPQEKSKAKNHLLTVNKQWAFFENYVPKQDVQFSSDLERISFHLKNVSKLLKKENTAHLNNEQRENRLKTISILEKYAIRKIFPTNHYHVERRPYFIDNYGVHCAVGYLIKETGFPEISKEIARTQNYAYVKEIESEALLQWAKDHGFSVQELAWIQPGYPPRSTMNTLGTGANGEIIDLHINNSVNEELIVAGSFTELGESPCLNIGVYKENNYSCLGNGLDGTIEGIISSRFTDEYIEVLVYGDFEESGIHYPLAKFENGAWSLIEITQRPNSIATSAAGSVSSFLVSVNVDNELHATEVYSFTNDQPTLHAEVYGELYIMDVGYNGLFPSYGGDFDSIYLVTEDTTYMANNVLFPSYGGYTTVEENVMDEVHHISFQGISVYLAGHSNYQTPFDFKEPLVTRYVNGSNQSVLTGVSILAYGEQSPYISTIKDQLFIGSYLYLAGDVVMPGAGWGIGGSGLLRINLVNGNVEFVTNVNGAGNRVISKDDQFILAGDFTSNESNSIQGEHDVNRIGVVNEVYASLDEVNDVNITIFPNPVEENTTITLSLPESVTLTSVRIIDMKGSSIELAAGKEIQLTNVRTGTYVLVVETTDGTVYREKLVVL